VANYYVITDLISVCQHLPSLGYNDKHYYSYLLLLLPMAYCEVVHVLNYIIKTTTLVVIIICCFR